MEIYSTLKWKEKSYHWSTGETSATVHDEYSLNFIAGHWHLSRTTVNDYVRYGSCQWGCDDTARIMALLGLHYPSMTESQAA